MVYMMSYGMSIDNERHNALHPQVTTLCTTKKIENAIIVEGGTVTRVGFALDMDDMVDNGLERHDTVALLYHPMESKRYKLAVEVSNALYGMNFIDNVITFGTSEGYNYHKKPAGLVRHYSNANRNEVAAVFNTSKIFINPSNSEGLNLTPIEATLCGCPSVICDGAIDEIFIDGETCFIADSEFTSLCDNARELYAEIGTYRPIFRDNMREIVNQYTWDKLIKNFKEVL
jgi:glycosyltransferase involved in cell wall biosynthesis